MGIIQYVFRTSTIPMECAATSRADLRAMTDTERVKTLAEHLQRMVHPDRKLRDLASLSSVLRMVYTTRYLQEEINKGGYSQYFVHTAEVMKHAAAYHAMTLEGLRLLGLVDAAVNFERAWNICSQENVLEARGMLDDETDELFEALLRELDSEFCRMEHHLIEAREAYCREHMDAIRCGFHQDSQCGS